MKINKQTTLVMTKAEYDADADAYTENGFNWGFFEGLYAAQNLARQRGIDFPKKLFDDTMKLRNSIYQAVNK